MLDVTISGVLAVVDEGESMNLVVNFHFDGQDFSQAAILSLELTLYDLNTLQVINDRQDQDIKDANGGSLDADGTLTLELDGDDNPVLAEEPLPGWVEEHVARIKWTWNDGDGIRTGIEEFKFGVRRMYEVSNA